MIVFSCPTIFSLTEPRSQRNYLNICTNSTWSPTPLMLFQRASWTVSLSCSTSGWPTTSWQTRVSLPTPLMWQDWWSWTWALINWRESPLWAQHYSICIYKPTRSKVECPHFNLCMRILSKTYTKAIFKSCWRTWKHFLNIFSIFTSKGFQHKHITHIIGHYLTWFHVICACSFYIF